MIYSDQSLDSLMRMLEVLRSYHRAGSSSDSNGGHAGYSDDVGPLSGSIRQIKRLIAERLGVQAGPATKQPRQLAREAGRDRNGH